MNSFAISCLVTAILTIILAFLVLGHRGRTNRLWFLTSLAIFLWTIGLFGSVVSPNPKLAFFSQRILYIGTILLPVFFFHYIAYLTDLYKTNRHKINIVYVFTFIFLISSFTKLFLEDIGARNSFDYWPVETGPIYPLFLVFFIIVWFYSLLILYKTTKIRGGYEKKRLQYMLYASLIGVIGGSTNFLLDFNLNFYPVGNFFVSLYAIFMAYAIIKYRLMNIRLILTRSILYGVLVGAVASFFSLSVLVVGETLGGNTRTSKIITYIITSLIVVIALDPVKRTWAKITDSIFYKDKIDYQAVLREAGDVVAREIDLEKLLQGLADLLVAKLKIKGIAVLVSANDIFKLVAGTGKNKKISVSNEFINYLKEYPQLIIIEEAIRQQENLGIGSADLFGRFVNEAEVLKTELVIPVSEQKKLTAIFLLGGKNSGDLYSSDEVNFFRLLIPQVAMAIEKSKLYEEVERFNIELQAKVEEKTKSLQEVNLSLEERNKFLTTVQVVTNMVSRTLDLKKVNQMIADCIASELGYVGGILSFVHQSSNTLRVGAITNNEKTRPVIQLLPIEPRDYETILEVGYNLGAQTVLDGKINFSERMSDFLSPPVDKAVIDKIQAMLGVKTAVGVPIFSEAKIIGIIHFLLPVARDRISSMDIEIMTALTNQVGIVSRNIKLYETLQGANRELQDANLRLRELDKAKSEFLSIASHQLRTPISAIKGYLSMIIDGDFGPIPKSIDTVVKNLFESASRLARLINIFLNVSRIESGRLKLEKKPLQINELIDSVITELINQAKQKNVLLEYKKAKKAPPLILADSDKLREVILNLIDNAIKYTPQGHIDVKVKIEDKNLKFIVEDTGIGIDSEEVKTLFRKFVRGSGVAQIHTGGSGLGLFIAQKIIKEHGGEVWAESDGKGKGSRFQFVLPVYDGQEVPVYKETDNQVKK